MIDIFIIAGIVLLSSYAVSKLNYVIDDRYLRLRFGPLRIRKISIDDICDARLGVSHWVEGWANTLNLKTLAAKAITVYRRSGYFKKVCLTPDDPGNSSAELKATRASNRTWDRMQALFI